MSMLVPLSALSLSTPVKRTYGLPLRQQSSVTEMSDAVRAPCRCSPLGAKGGEKGPGEGKAKGGRTRKRRERDREGGPVQLDPLADRSYYLYHLDQGLAVPGPSPKSGADTRSGCLVSRTVAWLPPMAHSVYPATYARSATRLGVSTRQRPKWIKAAAKRATRGPPPACNRPKWPIHTHSLSCQAGWTQ